VRIGNETWRRNVPRIVGVGDTDPRYAGRPAASRPALRRRQAVGGRPAPWDELVQVHDDRDIFFQASRDELPVIDIHSL
jgi:hypothetical protein